MTLRLRLSDFLSSGYMNSIKSSRFISVSSASIRLRCTLMIKGNSNSSRIAFLAYYIFFSSYLVFLFLPRSRRFFAGFYPYSPPAYLLVSFGPLPDYWVLGWSYPCWPSTFWVFYCFTDWALLFLLGFFYFFFGSSSPKSSSIDTCVFNYIW